MNIETTYLSGTFSALKSTNIEGLVTLDQFVLRIQYMIQLPISMIWMQKLKLYTSSSGSRCYFK